MHAVLEEIKLIGIIPVIKIDNAEKAIPLAKALISGGISCAEVTFRTAQGEQAMSLINREVPKILLGAGTVLTIEQVDKAIAAGAKFIVTPGFNPRVVSYCIEKNIPITPGCSNPSDIEKALEMGLDTVKFFPAEQSGGLEYIKAIAAPYSSMSFIPTGGINAGNIAKYISYEKILACGGSWMVNTDLINAGDFDKITSLCKEALFNMLGFEIAHVGINAENEDAAMRAAIHFSVMFGFQNKIGNTSIFSGERIEIVKSPIHGKNGHIAVATNSFIRARAFLERFGIEFEANSLKMDSKGNPVSIYLKEEVCSFAIQLVQRK